MDRATRAPGIEALSSTTRLELAHRLHAEAVEKIRRLEADVESALAALEKATAELEELGVETNVRLRPPLEAARVAYFKFLPEPEPLPEAPLAVAGQGRGREIDESGISGFVRESVSPR